MINFRRCLLFLLILFQTTLSSEESDDRIITIDASSVMIMPQHYFPSVPAGNYSGITYLGNERYALVSDKDKQEGFFIFHITINDNGEVTGVENEGFKALPGLNNDEEAISYNPRTRHLYIGNEAPSEIIDIQMDSLKVINSTVISDYSERCITNRSIESVAYSYKDNVIYTINEGPLNGDNALELRLKQLNTNLKLQKEYTYVLDEPLKGTDIQDNRHAYGVSELLALSDGSLLVLERELYIRPLKLNSWVMNKIFHIKPGSAKKQFVTGWRTWLHLFDYEFANYEGMCEAPVLPDGRHVILLCADSQGQYKGVLKDYFRTIVF
jgi:uncharacterized protein YjiK